MIHYRLLWRGPERHQLEKKTMMHNKRTMLVGLALAASISFALAQGKPADITAGDDEPNLRAPAAAPAAPATVPGAPPATTRAASADSCKRKAVRIGLFEKAAIIDVTIQDSADGLVAALKRCNPDAVVVGYDSTSTKSAYVTVTHGKDRWANLKVPTDREARIRGRFYAEPSKLPNVKAEDRAWQANPGSFVAEEITFTKTTLGDAKVLK